MPSSSKAEKPVAVKAPTFSVHRPAVRTEERFLKTLLYGEVGVGKTTLAASAAEVKSMQDVLFVDAEAGELSLVGKNVDVITINTYKQLNSVFQWLRLQKSHEAKGDDDAVAALQADYGIDDGRLRHYKTVVIDSLSEVQKYLMYQLLSIDIGRTRLDTEPETAQQRDWLASAEMIRLLVRSFRDLQMHVIFICAEEANELGKLEPKLPGKLSGEVPGFMDIVGYLARAKTSEGFERRLYLASGYPKWKSKHRFVNLPELDFITDPTMSALLELDRKDATTDGNSHPQPESPTTGKQARTRARGRRPVRRGS